MSSLPAVLIYESIPEYKVDVYNHPLVSEIMHRFPTIPLFHVDSFSEAAMIDYAKAFIEASEEVLLVILLEDRGKVNGLASMLQVALTHSSKMSVVANQENVLLSKIKARFNFKIFETPAALQMAIMDWIRAR